VLGFVRSRCAFQTSEEVVLITPAWHLLLVNVPPMSIVAPIQSIDKRRMGRDLERSRPVAP
jgi:hypothetical protein